MLDRSNITHVFLVILLVLFFSLFSCAKNKQLTPEEKAHYEIPKVALQETSKAFDVLSLLMGEYLKDSTFFSGKIRLRAKVRNNTKYFFEQPVSLFIVAKDYKVIENEIGNRWPDRGVLLMNPSIVSSPVSWQPGETLIVTSALLSNK